MHKPVLITLANCIFDPENPNEQSDEQEKSMGNSLHTFGYLGDLIVVNTPDKKGKNLVHHGEHRIKKLIEEGVEKAYGFIEKMSKFQHKVYRQVMNKLHGTHDPVKDRLELEYFAKQNKLSFLSELIAQPVEQLILEQETTPIINTDKSMIEHHEDTFLHGKLKQLHFIFDNEGFAKIMPKIDMIMKDFKTDNHTDCFIKLVDFYFKHKKK